MALRTIMSSRIPMVIILGATGTGKTKLGVELALKFGTEIISADSMQVYKGLDLVTAKASNEERQLVRHHLVDILEPHQNFTVVDFRNRSLKIIDDLIQQGKIPLVVGGTNYYIESIVYKILVEEHDADTLLWDSSRRKRDKDDFDREDESNAKKLCIEGKPDDGSDNTDVKHSSNRKTINEVKDGQSKEEPVSSADINPKKASAADLKAADITDNKNDEINKEKLQNDYDNESNFTNEEIHDKLKAIDPIMASRLHPNNRRKVLRSIEVWLKTGRRHSEILDEQKLSEGMLRKPGATLIFWLKCDPAVHDERLDSRIDQMVKDGLVKELLDFHERHNKQRIQDGKPPDYTKGIFQSLGFKEFHEYLMMSEEDRNTKSGKELLEASIKCMKLRTRRYARIQKKMIKSRFLEHPTREIAPIYELDTTDISKWDETVKNKAMAIIESFINGTECQYQPLCKPERKDLTPVDSHSHNFCDTCGRIILGDKEFEIHMKSSRHLKVLKRKAEEKKKEQSERKTKGTEKGGA